MCIRDNNIGVQVGDTVAVMGSGTMGQLVIQGLKIAGAGKIIAVDISAVSYTHLTLPTICSV
ncbi:hypothetical protein CDFC105_64026 [Clostridioides difficile]|nr:hypothetical protein CDFC105_64026 [Clostridioides difficile]